MVTPGIHDLNEFKMAEKFFRIELSSYQDFNFKSALSTGSTYVFLLFHFGMDQNIVCFTNLRSLCMFLDIFCLEMDASFG